MVENVLCRAGTAASRLPRCQGCIGCAGCVRDWSRQEAAPCLLAVQPVMSSRQPKLRRCPDTYPLATVRRPDTTYSTDCNCALLRLKGTSFMLDRVAPMNSSEFCSETRFDLLTPRS